MMKKENGDHEGTMRVLEIHLISAQGLKAPSGTLRRMQTYALAWVDSAHKLRSRVDKIGASNPTWNDRFLFKVPPGLPLQRDLRRLRPDLRHRYLPRSPRRLRPISDQQFS
ncbi:uncharacterized protein Pyn_12934 [Prunus yedoensis var. nudiflora]|uniref:C2 domain-containing protein n=1 Tax=Prunus yedoensis var. nudiflora TaxID=2094558 RepID=A0A314XQM0_PRUYE|nr:uncharacterized protein Pyn_12934 [Prunus yedoensis var. nudiflora]